jgi:uracil phosphoribosyltransferase
MLRDKNTPSSTFRTLADELMTLLAYEATRDVRVVPHRIETPVAPTEGVILAEPHPLIVPILRAGLGMLDGLLRLMPSAETGFLGMVRDETTLQPSVYAERLPANLNGRQCYVLDPMLATGGSLIAAIEFMFERGATDVTAVCLLGSPEGVAAVEKAVGDHDVTLVLGALDEKLNEHGYIVPGLGDAGDRLYGVAG